MEVGDVAPGYENPTLTNDVSSCIQGLLLIKVSRLGLAKQVTVVSLPIFFLERGNANTMINVIQQNALIHIQS